MINGANQEVFDQIIITPKRVMMGHMGQQQQHIQQQQQQQPPQQVNQNSSYMQQQQQQQSGGGGASGEQPMSGDGPTPPPPPPPPHPLTPSQPNQCIRHGCPNPAVANSEWEDEYCSNECVVTHCRDVFSSWVESNQNAAVK